MQKAGPRVRAIVLIALLATAAQRIDAQSTQVWLPDGTPVRSLPDDSIVVAARAALDRAPNDPESYIALARAQAGVREMRGAVATLTRGIERFPNHASLYRWRGHRYLSLMQFERAQRDFDHGLALDSANYGIWYHRGVTHFARMEFADAADAFRRAQPLAPDSSELAGSTDWLWSSLQRAGDPDSARRVLRSAPRFRGVTNAYARRLDLYRGRTSARRFLTPADTVGVQAATLAYGLATWAWVDGQPDVLREALQAASSPEAWPGFAYIAATTDLAALDSRFGPEPPSRLDLPATVLACVERAPGDRMKPVLVQLGVMLARDEAVTAENRRVRDAVARRLRAAVEAWQQQLTGTTNSLPELDRVLGWQHVGGGFLLTALPNGQLVLEPVVDSATAAPSDAATELVAQFVEGARAINEPAVPSTTQAVGDTVQLSVFLWEPIQTTLGLTNPPLPPVRIAVGVQRSPTQGLVAINDAVSPRYPEEARSLGFQATVITRFVVDTTGRPDSTTYRLLNVDRPTEPQAARMLDSFLVSVRTSVLSSTYHPATLAGCRAPQLVQQPYVFELRR